MNDVMWICQVIIMVMAFLAAVLAFEEAKALREEGLLRREEEELYKDPYGCRYEDLYTETDYEEECEDESCS